MRAVLEDPASAPIDDARKALFGFVEKMTRDSSSLGQSDVDALKAVGWSEEAIYDAVTVCALFQFYNTWIDATGVQDLSREAYDRSAERLAKGGYVMK